MTFDKHMVDMARKLYNTVYVDHKTEMKYIGSKTGYSGDRIRIYRTGWAYESEKIIRDNDALAEIITEDIVDWLYEHETAYEDCKRYFDTENLELVHPVALEDWIAEHDQLMEDFRNYFEMND